LVKNGCRGASDKKETEQDMYKTPLAVAALMATTACAPFWARTEDGASRSWFNPFAAAEKDATETEEVADAGATAYAAHCAACHGAAGLGDGTFAADLPISPPDLTTLSAANAGLFPAERVMETIHGYPGKFHRGTMPEFERELAGPVVEWRSPAGNVVMTPVGLLDLLSYVESLQQET
jgi:mono/diheme cytochrome c family protein